MEVLDRWLGVAFHSTNELRRQAAARSHQPAPRPPEHLGRPFGVVGAQTVLRVEQGVSGQPRVVAPELPAASSDTGRHDCLHGLGLTGSRSLASAQKAMQVAHPRASVSGCRPMAARRCSCCC